MGSVGRWDEQIRPRRKEPKKRSWIIPAVAIAGGTALVFYLFRATPVPIHPHGQIGPAGGDNPNIPTIRVLPGDAVEVDGGQTTLAAAIARAARAGSANVRASGDARHGFVADVVRAIRESGAVVHVPDESVDPRTLAA